MCTFTFEWPHAAEEVYVTGTFDNWSKSEKLEKNGTVFKKKVVLLDASEKIYYKFVVDGSWITDHEAPRELDQEGNENNVLKPENITKTDFSTAIMDTVGPEVITVPLAGAESPEQTENLLPPGSFPETPANEFDTQFSVSPLPTAAEVVGPVTLAVGEKASANLIAEGVNNNVTLDHEVYENSDRIPGSEILSPVSPNMNPESSLAILGANNPFINWISADASTVALAGQVPPEQKALRVVEESQNEAKVEPKGSGVRDKIQGKIRDEEEITQKVVEAKSTSEGTFSKETEKSEDDCANEGTVPSVTAADAATIGATSNAKHVTPNISEMAGYFPANSVRASGLVADKGAKLEPVSPEVFNEGEELTAEAGESSEAAAMTAAVEDEKAVKQELLKEVKPATAGDECPPQPVASNQEMEGAVKESSSERIVSEPSVNKTEAPPVKESSVKPVESQEPERPAEIMVNKTNGAGPKTSEAPQAAAAVNGIEATETNTDVATGPATPTSIKNQSTEVGFVSMEKKKKNRFSAMFSKIKGKVGGKDKAQAQA